MAARGGRLYLGLTFPSTQGRELICRAACFLSPAPQKLALQGKETRHIILFFPPPKMSLLCHGIQFDSHPHCKTGGRTRGTLVQKRPRDLEQGNPQGPGADDQYW